VGEGGAMAVREGIDDLVLHLPAALRERAEEMASRESISLNLFLLMAVAEKLQRLQLQGCFELSKEQEARHDAGIGSWPIVH
jgi:hypothetical protein